MPSDLKVLTTSWNDTSSSPTTPSTGPATRPQHEALQPWSEESRIASISGRIFPPARPPASSSLNPGARSHESHRFAPLLSAVQHWIAVAVTTSRLSVAPFKQCLRHGRFLLEVARRTRSRWASTCQEAKDHETERIKDRAS